VHLKNIRDAIAAAESTRPFFEAILSAASPDADPVFAKGAAGSLPAFLISILFEKSPTPIVCVTPDSDSAAYLASDLEQVHPELDEVLLFPPTGFKPFDREQMHEAGALIARADVLQHLLDDPKRLIITSADAVFERVPDRDHLQKESIRVQVGETWKPDDLVQHLVKHQFEHVDFIEQPGQIALRGGILDVYSFTGDFPIRLEFFGDEVDSIREIDIHTQRSVSEIRQARIVPNLERIEDPEAKYAPFFDFLPPETIFVTFDEQVVLDRVVELNDDAVRAKEEHEADSEETLPDVSTLYMRPDELATALTRTVKVLFGSLSGGSRMRTVDLGARPQPPFNSTINLLKTQLNNLARLNIRTIVLCDSPGQQGRLHELLESELTSLPLELRVDSLHEGFELRSAGLAVYTDHQIFDRYHRPSTRRSSKKRGGLSLRELRNLNPGDFVVHIDYGIGRFAGLKQIRVRDQFQEAVRLEYRDDDVLYVNISALYKLHKYTGKEGHQPRLTKLGSGQWEKTKARAKKRVKDIARDLIKIYAKRVATPGYAYPPDTIWQREMEAAFEYEDTPDQAIAADAVKADMEKPTPMDRLVCGDVGFGKTEVAVRAAFKAVQDGKQVAILVPTTILAAQHFETFAGRLGRYPVRVEPLSRFQSRDEQKGVAEGIKRGEVDIVIGTHRMTSKDILFKRLGLVIIDEEQRFGVSAKEKLRALRAEVDTLTLTATPIPRTLQFSLMGARDLSIIATPPPNRQPILTEIHTFDKHLIRDAIQYELSRQGQVFFIHNRVQSIDEMSATLRALLPGVRIQVAHGQMKSSALERVMMNFKNRKFDVLVSTNIIENGLDIANANTMIIDRADRFGLAELHQLRGRVGRSNRKAFCYLLVPSIHGLTREARQRLQAVEEFSDLGSGFNLAMRDLDIRGAGTMLGAEQSGFIEDVGFETYQKILDEAVRELRAQEFADVFHDAPPPPTGDTAVDIDDDALIPADYLENHVERLNIYRRISEARDSETLQIIRDELDDRFGAPPQALLNLLVAMDLKNLGQSLRLPRVVYKNSRLFLSLPTTDADPHFYEHIFHPLLKAVAALDQRYVIKESSSGKTRVIIQDIDALANALDLLGRIVATVAKPGVEASA
jgi:transcription-repair coupling factor (superfamily II helicase)